MTEASRNIESGTESKKSQVLRPVVKRWLKAFRSGKDQHSSEARAEVVSLASFSKPATSCQSVSGTAVADNAERISELQRQSREVEVACTEWIDRCASLESSVDRAEEKCDRACERLTLAAGLDTDASIEGMSTLQASYRNFTLALELQEQKLVDAKRKLADLQSRQASLRAEVLALSEDSRNDEHSYQRAA